MKKIKQNGAKENREKFFEESRFDPLNQKFGLFSFSGTLAVSDQVYFQNTPCYKTENGEVRIGPKNMLISGTKKGKTREAYFSVPEYIAEGVRDSKKEQVEKEDKIWKPSGTAKAAGFKYKCLDFKSRKPKEGSIGICKKLLKERKKGNQEIGNLIGSEDFVEPYDRKREIEREEKMKKDKKIIAKDFVSTSKPGKFFESFSKVYGEKEYMENLMKKISSEVAKRCSLVDIKEQK